MKHLAWTGVWLMLAVASLFLFESTRWSLPAIAAIAFALASIRQSSLYMQNYKGDKR